MNISRLASLILSAALITVVASCDKEEEATVSPSLEGALSFYAPSFIEPGQTLTLTPKGIEHPEGKGVGYYWKVSPVMQILLARPGVISDS